MNIILYSLFSYIICVEYINCNQNKILTGTVTYNNSCEQIEPNSIAYICFDDVSIADGNSKSDFLFQNRNNFIFVIAFIFV